MAKYHGVSAMTGENGVIKICNSQPENGANGSEYR